MVRILAYKADPETSHRMTVPRRAVGWIAALVPVTLVVGWFVIFSLPGYRADPRSPRYVLWKHGLLPVPKDMVFAAMALDTDREAVVRGRTAAELQRTFGPLRRPGNLLPNQKSHLDDMPPGGDYAWLGNSNWVVEFENGRAVALVLRKG